MLLAEFVEKAHDVEGAELGLKSPAALPPNVIINLKKLERLGLLKDDVVLALIGQAPIDPLGLFSAVQEWGWKWEFEPLSFCMVSVLAKDKQGTIAFVTVDLIGNDLKYYVRQAGKLTLWHSWSAEHLQDLTKNKNVADLIQTYAAKAIAVGKGEKP